MVTVLRPGPGEEPISDTAGPLGGRRGWAQGVDTRPLPSPLGSGCSAAEHGALQPLRQPPRLQLWHLGFIFSHF